MLAPLYKQLVKVTAANTPNAVTAFQMPAAGTGNFRTPGQAGYANGNLIDYHAESSAGFEAGIGTYTTGSPNTIDRTAILESSNAGAAVDFSAGGAVTVSGQFLASRAQGLVTQSKASIQGLAVSWTSATQLAISAGSAFVEQVGRIVDYAGGSVTPTLSASAWFYIYLKGDGSLDVVATAPSSPYFGSARSKNSAGNEYRLIGQFRTNASSQIYEFEHYPQLDLWLYPLATDSAVYRILANGQAIVSTTVACSSLAPPQSTLAIFKTSNTDTAASMIVGDGRTVTTTIGFFNVGPGVRSSYTGPVNSSQQLSYIFSAVPAVGGGYIDILGYYTDR